MLRVLLGGSFWKLVGNPHLTPRWAKPAIPPAINESYRLEEVRRASSLQTTDQLLGAKPTKTNGRKPSRNVLRRLEKIGAPPSHKQATLL